MSTGSAETPHCLLRRRANCDDCIYQQQNRLCKMFRVHCYEYRLAKFLRQHLWQVTPIQRQQVVGFIKNHPVGSTRACPQGPKTREKLAEERRSICKLNSEQIDI